MKPKLNRNEAAAVRGEAIKAFARANPHLSESQMARQIGVSRHAVKYHLNGWCKTSTPSRSGWVGAFNELCRELFNGDTTKAAGAAEALRDALRDGPTDAVDGIQFNAPTTRFYEVA